MSAFPAIDYRQTQAAANNQLALSQQGAAGRTFAGAGLSRGQGQRVADQYRADQATASGIGQGMAMRQEDQSQNAGMRMADNMTRANERLQYDSLSQQMRQSMWDSRFNNMTTAWGALAGLLR